MKVLQGYDYDDVLLIPKVSSLSSRDDVDLKSNWHRIYPVISSPMRGISGVNLVKEMAVNGCLGILHRFGTYEERINNIKELGKTDYMQFGVAVGIKYTEELDIIKFAVDNGAWLICVDIANGYLKKIGEVVKYASKFNIPVMAGNVVTKEGADFLYENGATFIRAGIGGGTLCLTRNVTGIGMPQLSALDDINSSKYRDNFYLVSDGGISNSGNAVKSFAAGADFAMVGSLFAKAEEAENSILGKDVIWGMASREIQDEFNTSIKSIEGMRMDISNDGKRPLREILREFLYGIKSACTYLNCRNYMEIINNAKFVTTGRNTLKNV